MKIPSLELRNTLLFALCGAGLLFSPSCSEVPADRVDTDNDAIPDQAEDRNQNGRLDPGETDPNSGDTDSDGVDDEDEVATLACSKVNDRPFFVFDAPGADSELLVDAKVSERSMLRTMDNKAPGAVFADPDLSVAAVMIGKRPATGVATPSAQRDYEQRNAITAIGQILAQRTRSFMTVDGSNAELAVYQLRLAQPASARSVINTLASGFLNRIPLTGTLAAGGASGGNLTLNLLTIYRSQGRVVLVAAAALGDPPTDDALIRLDELTDGTNVAKHGSFTRHVCDQFLAKEQAKADILWMVDDSGSMEDDQMAVRAAASALGEVLTAGGVDYRLAVTRTYAQDQNSNNRGRLEGDGYTSNLADFQRDIVVGAQGGWEPGLQTAILAHDAALPATAAGAALNGRKLRADAVPIVIFMSDERDQEVECASCGGCPGEPQQRQTFCPGGEAVIDRYIGEYTRRGITAFAIVGDLPNGCQQSSTRDDFEPGQGYVELANATGGQFGSMCGDMRQNLEDVGRAATGVASAYVLSAPAASATLKVAIGPPGQGRVIPRSRTNGFDYDSVNNKIVFFGDARPKKGEEIVVGYRRWDWANNPATPGDGCDFCDMNSFCDPGSDLVDCQQICGGEICDPGAVCIPDYADCGDPSQLTPPSEECGGCEAGLVCDGSSDTCVVPCEVTGCASPQICGSVSHLCQVPNF